MSDVELRVLGPLEILVGGHLLALEAPKQRSVLTFLAINVGEVQSTDRIIDAVWGESPPQGGAKTLQYHVSKLRGMLGEGGAAIVTRAPGYVLELPAEAIDSRRFEARLSDAQTLLPVEPAGATRRLGEALGLWRGRAFADFEYEEFVQAEARRLEELRLAAVEDWGRAELACGQHRALVGEFEALVTEHPLRERMRAVLMVALYRSGRHADALQEYDRLRKQLVEQLGLDPSPELRMLEQRILEQDAGLMSGDPFAEPAPAPRVEVRNPYKGLRPFTEDDAADFYGRGELVERLQERLAEPGLAGRFVVVVGASGSGKSSLVRAGLIPTLRRGAVDDSSHWRIVTMFPGTEPVDRLRGLLRPGDGPEALVVIDQFEELFVLADSTDQRAFLDLVEQLVGSDLPVRLVATLRADFLDRPLTYPSFARLIDTGLMLVTPLQDDEVRAAVVEPAASVGVRVEPELVAGLIGDVASRAAALPLLQYALTDLFEHRRGDSLTLDAYRAAGGISGALARRADHTYLDLDEQEREAGRQVFLRLVTVTPDAEHLRRRVIVEELTGLPIDTADLDRVLDRFGRQRLLTFDRDGHTGEPTVEVAHEALLREWPRLWDWVETNREDIRAHRRLAAAVTEWEEADQDPGFLPTGSRLNQLCDWADTTTLALTATEREYLDAATTRAEDHRRRVVGRRRLVTATLLFAALIATALAVAALAQRNQTQDQTAIAEQQIRITVARELAGGARANLTEDPELSMLLALEAIDTSRRAGEPPIGDAVGALHEAVLASHWDATLPGAYAIAWSPGGRAFVTKDPEAPFTTALVIDVSSGELLHELAGMVDLEGVAWSPDGSLIATADKHGPTVLWDAATGERLPPLPDSMRFQWGLTFSPDGSLLAGRSVRDYSVTVVDTATGSVITRIEPEDDDEGWGIAFSPDGEILATVAWVESARISDQRSGDIIELRTVPDGRVVSVIGPAPQVRWIAFSPDGTRLAGVSAFRTIHIWDTETGDELLKITEAGDGQPAWSPDGSMLAIRADDRAEVWNATTGEREPSVYEHASRVWAVAFSPDGETVATVDQDAVRLWRVSHLRGEIARIPGSWRGLHWMPDGARIVATDEDGRVRLLDVARQESLTTTGDGMRAGTSVAVSADGRYIATADESIQRVMVLDSPTLQQVATPPPGTPLAFSPDGGTLAVGTIFGSPGVYLYEASTWRETGRFAVGALEGIFLPDGEHLLVSSEPGLGNSVGEGVLVDLERGVEVARLPLPEPGQPGGVSASQSGDLVAVAEQETGYVGVWETEALIDGADPDDALVATIMAPPNLQRVTLSRDGAQLFAVSGSSLTVIDIEANDRVYAIDLGVGIRDMALSPDGRHIAFATGSDLRIITTDIDELTAIADERIGRKLTDEECRTYLHVEKCQDR